MAGIIGDILIAIVRWLLADWAHALLIKAGTWLDAQMTGRTAKIVAGLSLGLAAYFLIPVLAGLLGL
jgi:hypothetical protein